MALETAEVVELLDALRRIGAESESVEVKSGRGGFPRSVRESVVAFANGDGGTVIVGVDEAAGFTTVSIPDISAYRDQFAQMVRDDITPALDSTIDLVAVSDAVVLVAQISPARLDQKPAYVTSQGVTTGAYIRVGDGDRRMTEGEIALTYSARSQPMYDAEAVEGTTVKDLDQKALARTLARARQGSSSLRDIDDLLALRRLKVISGSDRDSPATLAGLLTFGVFPQEFFPQLMLSVVVHPPEGDPTKRFLDNVTVRGNIPDAISEALSVIRRNLAARAIISDTGRVDRLDYPMPAIREALVNAALHRDYSPVTRGAQVQVDLYPDRLVVRSPGGLYGNIAVDDLGMEGTTSSRNSVLASLLSDAYLPRSEELVAENRASGVPSMIALARRSGLPRPLFRSTITSFVVTMSRSELLGPEVRAWINQLSVPLPTSFHEIALAMMRSAPVTNAMLREWGADRITAGQVLRDLTDQKIAVKEGGRRFARYELDPALRTPKIGPGKALFRVKSDLVDALRDRQTVSASEIQEATGLSRSTVQTQLNQLIFQGLVRAEGETRSPRRRYSWIGSGASTDRTET